MTNEVINKAVWESCEHEWGVGLADCPRICHKCGMLSAYPSGVFKQPVNFTPELYEWIEAQGLKSKFMCYVLGIRYHRIEGRVYTEDEAWNLLTRAPELKALALSRAIKEEK